MEEHESIPHLKTCPLNPCYNINHEYGSSHQLYRMWVFIIPWHSILEFLDESYGFEEHLAFQASTYDVGPSFVVVFLTCLLLAIPKSD